MDGITKDREGISCAHTLEVHLAQHTGTRGTLGCALLVLACGCALSTAQDRGEQVNRNRDAWRANAQRHAPAGTSPVRSQPARGYRSLDGSGNNTTSTLWGSAGTNYLRESSGAHYADGRSAPAGAARPSARLISNVLAAQGDEATQDERGLSTCFYEFGQFLDHDIGMAAGAFTESFDIDVPTGDPYFDPASTGTKKIWMDRSAFDPATGTTNARQQINKVSAFIDGSQIYGVDATRATWLRTGSGGHLKTRATDHGLMLPLNDGTMSNDDALGNPVTSLIVAGDTRANEQPGLTVFHTVFVREHNLQADRVALARPQLTDEGIYQEARRIVTAELQVIVYNEFLPALLGRPLPRYSGYKSRVNPGLSNVFATAAYRNGHSMVGPDIGIVDESFTEVSSLPLQQVFFNPAVLASVGGTDPIIRYFATDIQQANDTRIVDPLRNFLFGAPGSGGFDLAALNIQRGRDHGLADYNTVRRDFGLRKVRSFSQITSNAAKAAALEQLYGTVDSIDAWVGMQSEDHLPGASVGPTQGAVIADQFLRLRDGDRFFYRNTGLSRAQMEAIESTKLSDVLMRTTGVTGLQPNIFFAADLGAATCIADFDRSGTVNVADLRAFTRAFAAADPAADLDSSGTVDQSDMALYIREYLAGC